MAFLVIFWLGLGNHRHIATKSQQIRFWSILKKKLGFFFGKYFYYLILHGLNVKFNTAKRFDSGTEVNQVYSNPGYAKRAPH